MQSLNSQAHFGIGRSAIFAHLHEIYVFTPTEGVLNNLSLPR